MPKYIRHKASFAAVGEDGRVQRLNIEVDIIEAGTMSDCKAQLGGFKQIQTEEGLAVIWLSKGRYRVNSTGEILISDDPDAP